MDNELSPLFNYYREANTKKSMTSSCHETTACSLTSQIKIEIPLSLHYEFISYETK